MFPDLGRTLQSILDDGTDLTEKAVFQVAVRLVRAGPAFSGVGL